MALLNEVDYIVFVFSIAIGLVIGVYFYFKNKGNQKINKFEHKVSAIFKVAADKREQKGDEGEQQQNGEGNVANEYFLANRQLSVVPTAFSIFASHFSAIGMLGMPADVYNYGSTAIFGVLAYAISTIITAVVFIPIYYRNRFTSIFQYVECRFESKMLRRLTTTLASLQLLTYAAVCAYVPSSAFQQASGVPDWIVIIFTSIVTISYTTIGGIRAVVLVDMLQSFVMFIALVAILIGVLISFSPSNLTKMNVFSGSNGCWWYRECLASCFGRWPYPNLRVFPL